MRLINLLPWRQRQRRQRIRHWLMLFSLTVGLILLLATFFRLFSILDVRRQQEQNDYLTSSQDALQRLYQQRVLLQQQNKKSIELQQAREVQQKALQIWESRLIHLATVMPGGTWLSSLSLQKGQLLVKGHASLLEDLQGLEKELVRLDGVYRVRAGPVQHEAQGGFGFAFILTLSEVADVLNN